MIWSKSIFFSIFLIFVSSIWWLNHWLSCWLCWDVLVIEAPLNCFLLFDKVSILFALTVSVVGSMVFLYSLTYMNSIFNVKFIISLSLFMVSMFFLIFSADLFWLMIGWDGLGISSMFLIFFFQNWKSFNSGMVTFLTNRIGDFCIISSVSITLFFSNCFFKEESVLLSLLVMLGAFSKSAQIPFSSWLPLAMAAPTPVSALVHSSTLVTAGIYLLIRFYNFLNEKFVYWTSLVLSLTFILGSSSSLGEYDFKKIIALSTLSHIGLMTFFIFLGSLEGTLLHLILHAFFKSLLFMIAGCIIHENNGEQDIRLISVSNLSLPLNIGLLISSLSMIGIPFVSGFYSKEFFLSMTSLTNSSLSIFILLISVSTTCAYTVRMLTFIFSFKSKKSMKSSLDYWMIFIIMSIISMSSGLISWSIVSVKSEEIICKSAKVNLLLFFITGMIIAILINKLDWIQMKIHFFLNHMWGMSKMIFFFQKTMFVHSWNSLNKLDSKGVLDYIPLFLIRYFMRMGEMIMKTTLMSTPTIIASIMVMIGVLMLEIW